MPKTMPKSLVIIGSGAIGSEFASFYLDMGVEVTLVEAMDRILPVEDAEISDFVQKAFVKQRHENCHRCMAFQPESRSERHGDL